MARPEQKLHSTKYRQDRYLKARAKRGTLSAGCRAARVSPHTVYRWREEDQADGYTAEEFSLLERQIVEEFADRLEEEAERRAVQGVVEPVYQGGKLVGKVRKYSDTMLAMLLNGARPEKYQRQRHEHTGKDGKPIAVQHNHQFSDMSDEELRRFIYGESGTAGEGQSQG